MVIQKLSTEEFSLETLVNFAKTTYPYFFSNADKKRESVYYRRVLIYIGSNRGFKKFHIAQKMDMTHPNVLWNYNKAESHISNGDELFITCYNNFVNRLNNYLSPKEDVLAETTDSGDSAIA